ncbi:Orotate phosphoribosyltransferase [Pseudidiomarina piscicola]|uniref:Orotate phosphoribosyltransferase n=1 Tax=Pseudidiomarina piscicola TaxID=2614830 RepID=A0A6S6WMQ8_9GAMM|nr:phosphoribosyltransferase family protein [Pseudidiomarina piscicola]CAB0150661.1 Orotate phosphoribosyltransferase [Pseudidiomarina piscicola]VZT40165.1 Orotate phosphoribosyltransferase [Pseudomonas aeruginosa]
MVPLQTLLAKLPAGCCWLCKQGLLSCEQQGLCRSCFADLPRLPPNSLRWRGPPQADGYGRYWFAALAWQCDSQRLVRDFKFRRCPELASVLAPLLAAHVYACYQQHRQCWPDLIVAMPMSRVRWRKRGYNQAALLATELAQLLQLPFAAGLLRRLNDEGQQHQLSRTQRWQAMAHALHCTRSVKGLTIAVVDDVLTTGASVTAAAAALQRRGAKAVDVWALCYTEPHRAGQL